MEHDFYLNKTTFYGSIRIRCDIPLKYLPSRCVCGQIFNLENARSCKKGGFIILRHNELRDFKANLLSEVFHDVQLEPQLQVKFIITVLQILEKMKGLMCQREDFGSVDNWRFQIYVLQPLS